MTVYTHGHHESVLRSHRWRTLENSAAYLLPHLSPDFHVLDVGCGSGTITADLASRVTHVTAAEHTSAALDLARAQMAGRTNVSYVVTDAHALDLPDDSFDVVHAHQVLQHVHDPVQALREMRRVCKPGGLVAVRDSDYLGFTWFPQTPAFDQWMRLYQEAALANGGEPQAGRRLLTWARAAGFTDVDVDAWRVYNVDDARAFLTEGGIDVDAMAPKVEGKFASAFIRATRPAAKSCCGPECCA